VSKDRSFTVRVPREMYTELAELAQADGQNLNAKVNQLLRLGMGKHVSLDQALRLLLIKAVVETEE
jgi:hypothetical protein